MTFDEHIAPGNEIYVDLEERLGSWNIETMQASVELDGSCNFNWKILVDNLMHGWAAPVNDLRPSASITTASAINWCNKRAGRTIRARAEVNGATAGGG